MEAIDTKSELLVNGINQLEDIERILLDIFKRKAESICKYVKNKKITTDIVNTALTFLIGGGEIYEEANTYAEDKVKTTFDVNTMSRVDMRKAKPKDNIPSEENITDAAVVYMNAIIEYIRNYIESRAETKDAHGFSRVVKNNAQLSCMFEDNNISFLSNTVTPYLSFGLYRKAYKDGEGEDEDAESVASDDAEEAEKKEETEEGEEKEGKRKSKILSIVKGLQDMGDCIILPRSAMSRVVREISAHIDDSVKIGMDTPIYIQYIVEQDIINILRWASFVSFASKSTKLNAIDIDIAMSIRNNKLPVGFSS